MNMNMNINIHININININIHKCLRPVCKDPTTKPGPGRRTHAQAQTNATHTSKSTHNTTQHKQHRKPQHDTNDTANKHKQAKANTTKQTHRHPRPDPLDGPPQNWEGERGASNIDHNILLNIDLMCSRATHLNKELKK